MKKWQAETLTRSIKEVECHRETSNSVWILRPEQPERYRSWEYSKNSYYIAFFDTFEPAKAWLLQWIEQAIKRHEKEIEQLEVDRIRLIAATQ